MTTAWVMGVDMPPAAPNRFALGGVNLSCIDRPTAVEVFIALVSARSGGYVTITDAHSIVAAQADPKLREIINGGRLALPDGMPSVWLGRLKGHPVRRVAGADFLADVLADPRARGMRHAFYGGNPESIRHIVARAEQWLGPRAIAGGHAPPLRETGALEDASVIDQIASSAPDVIWVGLGAPKQDYWMANHTRHFPNTVLVGAGAALDFFADLRSRAPVWMQSAGLEWLFRLSREPQRLWPRYRKIVPGMLRIMIAEAIHR